MRTIRVSVIGFGAVGQGVARVLIDKKEYLENIGLDFRVVAVADSRTSTIDENGVDLSAVLARKQSEGVVGSEKLTGLEIIETIDHDLVVETTPTNIITGGVGLQNMLMAFKNGRDVVTSNKGPLAMKYGELIEASKAGGSRFRFEATVGGAMPVLNLANDVLAGNIITNVEGIFNGTCNYILTRMMEEHASYEQMLAEAQELGFAETDPTYDVEGIDTACKLVILANCVFGMNATHEDVTITGITKITPEALLLAQNEGYVIKLIGEVNDSRINVAPKLVPIDHPLAVGGSLNVASVQTDLSGPITVTGRGAGSIETASAILSDMISIYRD
ncbi:homoserine dehydrogenase [Methanolobus vulcani]|jgi:homoserine dehydrogenase|uniref:Homoserine dehydrogenase n=1 Tax=Methanolobus vulcani TaxID=38026 RepID=A0A7Z7AZL2_9EURY|nr:homoserine dehydrogenase [Methanolobus vulcani]MDK2825129.1 homoserine dehydrogenase [Methanolobus sp.]MDK2947002.1 homoserine dehydrogenase [Methanolobus sp.]SDF26672.1 homoserine dehydrogenase [Methanolobus vulcani]